MPVTINGTTGISTSSLVASTKVNTLDLELNGINVVERGSNANGAFVRFADGTQICTHRLADARTYSAAGSVFASANEVWTFPASFLAEPIMLGKINASTNPIWVASSGTGSTSNGTGFLTVSSGNSDSGVSRSLEVTAIGRWF